MDGIKSADIVILISLVGTIVLFLIIGFFVCLKNLSDKKKFNRPYTPFKHITATYATILASIIIYVLSFGYFRFFALLVMLPYLCIFAVVCGNFGKFADYYPKKILTVNKLTHISFLLPNLFCPDHLDNGQWVFCRILPIKSDRTALIFTYMAFGFLLINIALMIVQIVLTALESKNVKKIIDAKKKAESELGKTGDNGKFVL